MHGKWRGALGPKTDRRSHCHGMNGAQLFRTTTRRDILRDQFFSGLCKVAAAKPKSATDNQHFCMRCHSFNVAEYIRSIAVEILRNISWKRPARNGTESDLEFLQFWLLVARRSRARVRFSVAGGLRLRLRFWFRLGLGL